MIDLKQVLTFTEAAEKWGLAGGNTLRQAVARGRFHEEEIRKSGTVWLTTYEAMTRVFGPLVHQKPTSVVFEQSTVIKNLLNREILPQNFEEMNKEAVALFNEGKQLQIRETLFGKEVTLYLFTSKAEWEHWLMLISKSIIPKKLDQTR